MTTSHQTTSDQTTSHGAPYGTWRSPVTTDMIVAGGLRFAGLVAEGERCYWTEGRAAEGGRNVLVVHGPDGVCQDLTAAPYNVRTRAHEYGGGAFAVGGGEVWFVNFDDQGLYHRSTDGDIRALCVIEDVRFADFVVDRDRGRLICVVEDHRGEGEEENYLGAIDLATGGLSVLARGHDFYASPTLHPDGSQLAWIAWDHPRMPWDGTVLEWASLGPDGLGVVSTLAGGDSESVFQPLFAPNGDLWFAADPKKWWSLFRWDGNEVHPVCQGEREFARPQWVFGMRTFGFIGERLLASYCEQGDWHLAFVDGNGALTPIELDWHAIDAIAFGTHSVFLLGGAPDRVGEVARLSLSADGGPARFESLRVSTNLVLDAELVSVAEPISYATSDEDQAHGYYYAPRNPDFEAPADERPPLIVIGHGGPTASTSRTLSPAIQYWTSRGFAVLDVNYRGSTGYGRAYRDRLKGKWGIYDVADCVHGARALVERGLADPARLAIRGGSAGGYTALAALTFHDTFTAGASYYGISELEVLARDTHKFESRYLDSLIGPYPSERQRYFDRSPIHFTDQLSCPVIFFQGLDDKVVPPNQAEMMVQALREKGLPVAYIPFEGEQHGFRAATTIKRTLEAELYFYARIFGFTPADEIEPVPIEGLA